ncbi:N-acetylmuramoyl-L-alanine amidase [Herbaspirillum sp. SJZ107]|nr:caspase family protein [Herbaspirillum sp. SJZ107]TQK03502.1 N-acetylmuramoyl-L-alanine amidase [Herbaspirillum sp. SJZ107]
MRPSFKKVSLDQFSALLARFPFSRSINAVHMHHTWRPDHHGFKGEDTIVAMWRYHTEHNGWSDIAQHITIDPNGEIWLGRDWNKPPASARGFNGDDRAGPFMFEMIGDFDVGADPFGGKQRATAVGVVAMLQQAFDLPLATLKFHNMMSGKTCPGDSIDYERMLDDVMRKRREMGQARRALPENEPPFHADSLAANAIITDLLEDMQSRESGVMAAFEADADACTHHPRHHEEAGARAAYAGQGRREAVPLRQPDLRPHLVNLSMGELSGSGQWTTTRQDVEAIFSEHLPRALERAQAAQRPLRLMFQAHGGLNDEAAGLAIARKSVAWWLDNDIYPIYFVWETGLFESVGQLLQRAISGKRDFADYTSDPLIQETVRFLGGPKIWGVMKQNARTASSPDTLSETRQVQPGREGGAYLVAQQLAAFCKRYGDAVELHAVGHSAGAIFHSWFIPCALDLGVPAFRSLHLMAPAVRVDLFKEKLALLVGDRGGIRDLTVYTMKEALEARDNCAGIYNKSLLYLIFHALEPQRKTPILGLEESLRADADLSRLFGLSGGQGRAEVIWSQTPPGMVDSASRSTTHGGFDDDRATMGSIARRILNRGDDGTIVDYPSAGAADRGLAQAPAAPTLSDMLKQDRRSDDIRIDERRGTRRALCVGINAYPTQPLAGCLADVESWRKALDGAGFAVTRLLDQQATRDNIIGQLKQMIAESRAGDVIVFQYAGHGTEMPDLNHDEEVDGKDQAIVPYDYQTGAFLLDDELGEIYAGVPAGVNLTCFMDCCHSGDNRRLFIAEGDQRQRFMPPTQAMIDAFLDYRKHVVGDAGAARAFAAAAEPKVTYEVSFAACARNESAWESQGQGEFTARATRILETAGARLTNGAFIEQVRAGFGKTPRQHVQLDASSRTAAKRPFLQPLPQPSAARPERAAVPAPGPSPIPDAGELLGVLRSVERLLQQVQLQQTSTGDMQRPNGGIQHPPPQSLQSGGPQNR